MHRDKDQTQYPTKVWAAVVSAAVFAVSTSAYLWVFFGQGDPMMGGHMHRAPPLSMQIGSVAQAATR